MQFDMYRKVLLFEKGHENTKLKINGLVCVIKSFIVNNRL